MTLRILTILVLSLLYAVAAYADVEPLEISDSDTQETTIETRRYASVESGYRFITPDGPSAAASPYGRLNSGVTGGFSAGTVGSDLKLTASGNFLHVDDYHTELFFDYRGLVHSHIESTAMWHNLLREEVNPGTSPSLKLRPLDQNAVYGVRTAITQVDTRIRMGNNPIHLNIGYWELNREGYEQLRFSDYYRTNASTVVTESNRVDRTTREGSVGLDAHLGVLDLSYGFRIRDFSNGAADPRDNFNNKAALTATDPGSLIPGIHAHDVIPDSRVTSHTIKLFSDLSGGLVGTASYNLTQRENSGGHGEAVPSERPSDLIHSVAGDLVYTPSKRHSFALKYRHREIDRTTPAMLYYPYSRIPASPPEPPAVYTSTPGLLLVRPASSSVRDTLTFSATFRPAPKVIYRLEYNAELESRDNVTNAQATPGSLAEVHSDQRQTHTGIASFYWKPVKGLKVNASYSYASSDNPAYGSSFSDRHVGKLLLTYANNGRWGATASYLAQYESGKNTAATVSPAPVSSYDLPRQSRTGSGNASVWFSPIERLTLTTNYSYLETDTDQSILFTNIITDASPQVVSNYRSSAHVYGIDAVYAVSEPLDIALAFQQVRSKSRFSVPDRSFTLAGAAGIFTTSGITDLTKLDSTETGVSARADWRINAMLGCSLDYSFRMYDSGQSLYDGSVHSTMLTLKARW
jgi:hypothetical protein